MPMMPDHFPNFYMGAAAEAMFAGEMYLLGYEAAKYSPDFGIDFSITNAARQKFYNEPAKSAQIQIKSTFSHKGRARVTIGEDDFSYICESSRRFLVVYIFQDFYKPVDPDSANVRPDMAEQACQRDMASQETHLMENYGPEIKREDPRTVFEFRYQNRTVFWLNGKQLAYGLKKSDWKECGSDKLTVELTVRDSGVLLNGDWIFPELLDLEYIMSSPSSEYAFEAGKYSYEHL